MNCLPILDRELRVAARKRSTFWFRVAAAGTGIVIGSGGLTVSLFQRTSPSQIGTALFYILTWTCMAAGMAAGLFFTSDCLSEEKRDGTLGLLFLTELRGYDVVLGKLIATSLRAFYALLAVLPILAITQLMGGITGAQYWKSALGLVNGLLFSLSAGLLISALSRDSQKALAGTLFVLLLLSLGGPLADGITAGLKKRGFQALWSLSSPGYVLVAASAWGRSGFWQAVMVNQLLAGAMFVLASVLVPHSWQTRKSAGATAVQDWRHAWKYGSPRRRARLHQRLLEPQPIAWLVSRERWQSLALWVVAILITGGFAAALISNAPREVWILWMSLGGVFTLILYIWAASQSSRFLVEARRGGFLELLLVTPINERQIVRGQWRMLTAMAGMPVLLLLAVHLAGSTLAQLSYQRLISSSGPVAAVGTGTNRVTIVTNQVIIIGPTRVSVNTPTNSPGTGIGSGSGSVVRDLGIAIGTGTAATVSTVANLLALCWFGMWMGMTSKSANLATLKTIVFVQVIPWFVMAFGGGMLTGLIMMWTALSGSPNMFAWWVLITAWFSAATVVAKDIGFILWSRNKLLSSLRDQAVRNLGIPSFQPPAKSR
jgi:hypothetical protein